MASGSASPARTSVGAADEVDPRRADQVEEDGKVACHALLPVAAGVVWLRGAAVPPGVGGDDPAPPGEQRLDDAGGHPVGIGLGDEAVVQDDGRRLRRLAPFLVGDLDSVSGLEALDGGSPPRVPARGGEVGQEPALAPRR
jgi:hypothetical protein